MYFKLFGLRFSNPSQPPVVDSENYLSNLQFANSGDVMIDNDGNTITFGTVGIRYGSAPDSADMSAGETALWYSTVTQTLHMRTLELDGTTVVDSENYLSNLQFANSGDVMIDNDGNTITFGTVGIRYGSAPDSADMSAGETALWYSTVTQTLHTRTLELDGTTVVDVDLGEAALGDMLKATYDSNNDGIVNAADMLKVGSAEVTATTVNTHINNTAIHAEINDAVASNITMWSSLKVSNTFDNYIDIYDPNGIVDDVFDMANMVEAADAKVLTAAERADFHAHDNKAGLDVIGASIDSSDAADILVFDGAAYTDTALLVTGRATLTYDPCERSMTLDIQDDEVYEHIEPYFSSVWTIEHGLNEPTVYVRAFNDSGAVITPYNVVQQDDDTVILYFSQAESGWALVGTCPTVEWLNGFTGDMLVSTYDPNDIADDVFDMANMVEATDAKVMTAAERASIAALGTIATQNANSVAITGGNVTGITDLAIADGGTGASTVTAARSNLEIDPLVEELIYG